MSSPFVNLLGAELLKGSERVPTADALAGKKAVGLYFSAHWCPPCRGYTPQLAKWYTKDLQAKGLEIVFCSSDRDEKSFAEYYGEQPWLSLPFENRDAKNALSKKYKVSGIPTLVILDGETGETITLDGREATSEDPTGKSFPWKPPTFWEALGTEFLSGSDGDTVDVEDIKGKGKVIGLYFSAHWCPPCRQFTPALVEAYKSHLKAKNLEIIFVSSDRDAASFQEYYGTMPWLAIPNGDPRKAKLSKRFGVEGIPSFALVDGETGETINANARGKVSADPQGTEFPWLPKPVNDLNDGPDGINEELTVVALLEGCDEATRGSAIKALNAVAAPLKAAKDSTLFFYASKAGSVSDQVRKLCSLPAPADSPALVLLDIPDEGGYYVSTASEVTEASVGEFLAQYKSKSLERKQLS